MNSKSKLAVFAAVALIGIATPAFTQSVAANTYGRHSSQAVRLQHLPRAHVRSGLRALGMVPGAAFNSLSPSATGGGSIGYNSHNETHF
jgi:hypothetical protein